MALWHGLSVGITQLHNLYECQWDHVFRLARISNTFNLSWTRADNYYLTLMAKNGSP